MPYAQPSSITPSEKDIRRFHRKTNKIGSAPDTTNPAYAGLQRCWNWMGCRRKGYGSFSLQGTTTGAHRASWIIHHGQIPQGMVVMHKCDNPRCVNPDHLMLGTPQDNMRDCQSKGRHINAGAPKGKRGQNPKTRASLPPVKERAKIRNQARSLRYAQMTQSQQG